MADNEVVNEKPSSLDNMLKQIETELQNSQLKAFKAKVAEKVKVRDEHTRALNQINAEINKMFSDARLGIF